MAKQGGKERSGALADAGRRWQTLAGGWQPRTGGRLKGKKKSGEHVGENNQELDNGFIPSTSVEFVPVADYDDDSQELQLQHVEADVGTGHRDKKPRTDTSGDNNSARELLACCLTAAEKFDCIFVQNIESKRIHALSDVQVSRTRGCKWEYKNRPHRVVKVPTNESLADAVRCSICLPLQFASVTCMSQMPQVDSQTSESAFQEADNEVESCSSSENEVTEVIELTALTS